VTQGRKNGILPKLIERNKEIIAGHNAGVKHKIMARHYGVSESLIRWVVSSAHQKRRFRRSDSVVVRGVLGFGC
jgi:Mor family transcriptional regulator